MGWFFPSRICRFDPSKRAASFARRGVAAAARMSLILAIFGVIVLGSSDVAVAQDPPQVMTTWRGILFASLQKQFPGIQVGGDGSTAFDPNSGRNFAWDGNAWIDTKTLESICPKVTATVTPPTTRPFGLYVPSGVNFEGTLFAGRVAADSFGTDYSTILFGGRGAMGISLPGRLRLQLDLEGEKSGNYSAVALDRSYLAGGAHLDVMLLGNTEVGIFGGLQDAQPTFGAPRNTNSFWGIESRVFLNGAVIGGNIGRFDNSSGTGTITDAAFISGRAKFDINRFYQPWGLPNLTLEIGMGHAWGKLQNGPLDASSTEWHATLGLPFANSPVTAFFNYTGHSNRVQTLGTVWTEHVWKAGITANFGATDTPQKNIEPMQPLTFLLGTALKF